MPTEGRRRESGDGLCYLTNIYPSFLNSFFQIRYRFFGFNLYLFDMKILITENQSLFLKRRLSLIGELVHYVLYDQRLFDEGWYLSEFFDEVCWRIYDLLYEEGIDIGNDTDELFDFIKKIYGEEIETQYYKLQGDVVNDDE